MSLGRVIGHLNCLSVMGLMIMRKMKMKQAQQALEVDLVIDQEKYLYLRLHKKHEIIENEYERKISALATSTEAAL